MQRTLADTTWDLESQARMAQGADALAGEKPGDSMPGAGAPSGGSSAAIPASSVAEFIPADVAPAPVPAPVIPAPVIPEIDTAVAQVNSQIDAALSSVQAPAPQLPDVPTLPQIDLGSALPGLSSI